MDLFEIIVFLLFLLFPLLQRSSQKKKQQQRQQQQQSLPQPPASTLPEPHYEVDTYDGTPQPATAHRENDELDEALREIRTLLGMPEPEPAPAPPKPNPAPVTLIRRPEPPTREPEFRPPPRTFHEEQFEAQKTEAFESHDDHDLREDAFEALAPYEEPKFEPKVVDKKQTVAAYEAPKTSRRRQSHQRLLKRLREAEGAREAILLSEILGPPKGRL